jgi:very-short-patch-repair endonuclease
MKGAAQLEVEILARPTLTFATAHAGVPVVEVARIANRGSERLVGASLVLVLGPELGEPMRCPIEVLHPGEEDSLGPIDLELPPERLRTVLEAEQATLTWQVVGSTGLLLLQGQLPIEVHAWNEWPGERCPPALLAVFSTPNHPVVATVLRRVSAVLGEATGSRSLSGYQTGDVVRVLQQVQALYETVQALGISYVGVPASFEALGQKVRLPDVVLRDQLANCLDLTLLFASCLEQMGLHPLMVAVKGHAFPGVWLVDDRFPECVVYDAARLRTAVALDQLVFFDSSATIADPAVPFGQAQAVAHRALSDDENFRWALDVRVARTDRWRPLPVRAVERPLPEQSTASPMPSLARELLQEAVDAPPPREAPPPPAPLVARFARWKERLLDLSLRNKLLAFRSDVKTALPMAVPDVARFEDGLAAETVYELLPKPDKDPRDERSAELQQVKLDPEELRRRRKADLERGLIHVDLTEAQLVQRAVSLDRATRTDLEEGGANTLFAAIGFLKWTEAAHSSIARSAPLLLVPVSIEFQRTTRRVRLRRLPEDAVANVTLIEKVRRDFAVDLSPIAQLESDDSGVDVPGLLRQARTAIARMPGWEVLEEVALGQFVFGKFLLWKDLDDNAAALLQSPVVQHIASGRDLPFSNPVEATRPETLDDTVPPQELVLPIDADSTQMAAIHSALKGRSFVLQGPPGTGKSQTITNLIAAALAGGKSVLFVAEKMAALEVVHRRLTAAGLGDFCLELHSHKANKKDVIASLAASLQRVERTADTGWDKRSRELGELRGRLNAYTRALHAPRSLGSFFASSGRLMKLRKAGAPHVTFPLPDGPQTSRETFDRWLELADRATASASNVEPVEAHPWRDCRVDDWSERSEQELRSGLASARDASVAVAQRGRALTAALGLALLPTEAPLAHAVALGRSLQAGPLPSTVGEEEPWAAQAERITTFVEAWEAQQGRETELATRWSEQLRKLDLQRLGPLFSAWGERWALLAFFVLFFARRELMRAARGRLPDNRRIASDLDMARTAEAKRDELARERSTWTTSLQGIWDGQGPDGLRAMVARGQELRETLRRARLAEVVPTARTWTLIDPETPAAQRTQLGERAEEAEQAMRAWREAREALARAIGVTADPTEPFPDATARIEQLESSLPAYRAWGLYGRSRAEMVACGLGPVTEAHRRGRIRADQLHDTVERSVLETWVSAIRDGEPALRLFHGREQHRLVERFQAQDREHQVLGAKTVVARLEQQLPASGPVSDTSEPGIILREARKKTKHKPIRRLLQEIPKLLPKLKPCLLMSPLSVAQYLPATGRRFDLVVFDEASQIGTHDAIGALARGNQVIVVGDARQLPPTAFFQRAGDEAPDDNDFVEMESILDEAVASGLPEQRLGWHYRSRHESLIAFSNAHYYEGKLNVFPAARGHVDDLGVSWHPVPDGVYDKGSTRCNRAEAEALVGHLVEALQRTTPRERTFGVVTFSQAQQTLVSDLLDEARREHPEIEPHFGGTDESVFIKNLENVQGDERDEILFSIGYGPDENGKLSMNFGPLNRDGGERRLNVAVTRARCKLRVFSTLTHEQIDLNRTRAQGARHLKEFLRYAQQQGQRGMQRTEASGDFDSDFEREVYDVLESLGHRVDTQVGCGAYRIDMAVVHPSREGEYVTGIECDGAAYHSGATARDRDRLRQQVLEGLGWKLHRIWSTDWWFERDKEIERLRKAVDAAIEAGPLSVPRAEPVPIVLPPPEPAPRPPPQGLPRPVLQEPVRLARGPDAVAASAPAASTAAASPPTARAPSAVEPYQVAVLERISAEPEELYLPKAEAKVRLAIAKVIALEAPLHADVLTRRVLAAFGGMKATAKARGRILQLAAALNPRPAVRGWFLWPAGADPSRWDKIRGLSDGEQGRGLDEVPPEELAAAAARVLRANLSMPETELIKETARLFGIARVGKNVAEAVGEGVKVLIVSGKATREGGQVARVG